MLALGILVALGLALRLVRLDTPLWGDEVASWAFARRSPFSAMWSYAAHDPTPPLYYAVLHLLMPIVGETPVGLRLPSVCFGVLTLLVMNWGIRTAGFPRAVALEAVLVAATSSMLIYYAQEARAYAMLAFLGTLATVLLFRASIHFTWLQVWVYAITVGALLFTHRYAFFLVLAHLLYAVNDKQWRIVGAAAAASALVLLTVVAQLVNGSFAYGAAGDATDRTALLSLFNSLSTGTLGLQDIAKQPNASLLGYARPLVNEVLAGVGMGLLVLACAVGIREHGSHPSLQRRFIRLLAICVLIPIACGLLAGSRLSPRPQWLLRGLIYIWPLYFMFLVMLVSTWRWRMWLLSAVVVLNVCSLYPYYTRYIRWGDAPAFEQLNRQVTRRDLVVADPWYMVLR